MPKLRASTVRRPLVTVLGERPLDARSRQRYSAPVPVPLLDLPAQLAPLQGELAAASARVLASGRFILGPEVEAFEQKLALRLDVPHAIGVSCGSDALVVALRALGVGAGDEVVTTPYTFVATAEAILRVGATPRFVDVEPATLCLDPASVKAALSPRTRAILPVHLFGRRANVAALPHDIPVVEDSAQAFAPGLRGAAACYSFFPAKLLGGFGDGGLVVTRDATLADRVRAIRQHGVTTAGAAEMVGGNFRLDALQAALLSVALDHVDEWIAARRENAAAYDRAFAPLAEHGLRTPPRASEYSVYSIACDRRDALAAHLARRGIATAVYYRRPLHLEPVFAGLGYRAGDFPVSERAAAEQLALPVHPALTEPARAEVIAAVNDFFGVPAPR